jgi:hypothetical protein
VPLLPVVLLVLAALLIVLLIVSTIWQFSVPVPFVPSSKAAVRAMVQAAELRSGQTILDLGAGDGRVLREACRACPGLRAIGVEAVPTTCFVGWLRSWCTRDGILWHRGSLFDYDVRHADCLFLYLYPKVMQQLLPKLDRELRPGARVVSHDFPFPDREPTTTYLVRARVRDHKIFVYDWPAKYQ